MEDIVIVAAARTAVGKFGGALAATPATELGAIVIKEPARAQRRRPAGRSARSSSARCSPPAAGQNPARQSMLKAGLPQETPALTINAVCGSGLKAVMLAAQAVALGRQRDRHRRRPGEHEPCAARAARLAPGPAHGRLEARRLDDQRRPVGRLQPVPHGRHRRERRQGARRHARAAGRAGAGRPAEGRGGAGSRPVQGRDRAGHAAAEEGRSDRVRGRRVHQPQDQRRGPGRPEAGVRQGRHA